jgi:ABC-type lipoprotein export system ATPase subunit
MAKNKNDRAAAKEPASEKAPPPPAKGHHTILSVEVTGGFLKGARLDLADGLNCIIGGRGTGKTTVLELIRYGLGLMPDPRVNPARARALAGFVQNNLSGGRVRVEVKTKHAVRYAAERSASEDVQVLDERGTPMQVRLDRNLIFTADVYSQNEIEEIASNRPFQLALIDKFAEEEIRRVDDESRRVLRDLDQNGVELQRVDRAVRDLGETALEAAALEERLKAFHPAQGRDSQAIAAAHGERALRETERRTIAGLREEVKRLATELEPVLVGRVRQLGGRIDAAIFEGPNKEMFEATARDLQRLLAAFEEAAARLASECESTDASLARREKALAEAHARQERAYRDALAISDEERERAVERTQLEQRYVEVIAARRDLELREKERRRLEEQRRELLARLSSLRDERFRIRKRVAERLTESLHPMIRVSVKQAGSRSAYCDLLNESLKGSGLRYATVVDKIAETTSPEELSFFAARGDVARLCERAGIDDERARKMIDLLRDAELVYKVGTVELEDLPRIELLDGKDYKDAGSLSTGQRCTTILPILLLESERPLLIDEPEGNLDNAFIYETVVKSLKGAKGRRQLIFVTHNPNIPVLGDAERVFVFTSDGKHGTVRSQGTVDQLKEQIETLLEGGRQAFLERKKRYGH